MTISRLKTTRNGEVYYFIRKNGSKDGNRKSLGSMMKQRTNVIFNALLGILMSRLLVRMHIFQTGNALGVMVFVNTAKGPKNYALSVGHTKKSTTIMTTSSRKKQ